MRKGQIFIDYLIILAVVVIFSLFVVWLFGGEFTQEQEAIDFCEHQDYWFTEYKNHTNESITCMVGDKKETKVFEYNWS